mgnify:CR=1 FL=1
MLLPHTAIFLPFATEAFTICCTLCTFEANVATTILGVIYGAWLPLHLLFLRGLGADYQDILHIDMNNAGVGYVVFLFVVILFTDTGCYYFGSKFGKNKLAPTVSPKKTVEGSLGGMFCALIGAFIVGYFIHFGFWHSLIMGLLGTVFAQIGDLCESLIKRDAGVKDSGDLLPGHGGFLDRTDSYMFTIPVLYYYLKCFVLSCGCCFCCIDFSSIIKGVVDVIGF